MASFTVAELLTILALTLMICGAMAYQQSGMIKSALSAIYVGNGGAVVSFLLAAGARNTTLKKGDSGYKIMMICVHLAIIWPLVMATAVGWRLWLAWNVPEKQYLKVYFSVIVVACLLTSAGVASLKPKKNENEQKETKEQPPVQPVKTQGKSTARHTSSGQTKRRPRKAAVA